MTAYWARRVATAHILQLALLFGLGAVVQSQHMTAPGQLRAVFALYGIVYALQVRIVLSPISVATCARVASQTRMLLMPPPKFSC